MPDPGSGPDALRRAVRAVGALAPDLDDVAVAEVLWLAAARDGRRPEPRPASDAEGRDTSAELPDAPIEPHAARRPAGQSPLPAPVRRRSASAESELYERIAGAAPDLGVTGRAVSVPRAGALPKALELGRALRPLKGAWTPGPRRMLDVEATAANYARSGVLLPALRARPERWLDLALVVDRSSSMAVWQDVAAEFAGILSRLGAFKRVQVLGLTTSPVGEPRLQGVDGRIISPQSLSRARAGSQILVLSDCSAEGWYQPQIWQLLHAWGAAVPTALINPLPSRLWRLTGLDLPAVRVTGQGTPATRNTRLEYQTPWQLRVGEAAAELLTPLPVAVLTPYALARWARVLMSSGADGCDAVLIPARGRFEGDPVEDDPQLSGAELVEAFYATSSAPATRLAVMCAPYMSLTMPLLHLIHQTMAPEATIAEVAEVVVSGLFTTDSTDSRAPVLRFRPGVQSVLQELLGSEDTWQMYDMLSRYVAAHTGSQSALAAALRDPEGVLRLPAELRPFAAATADTLRLLGALPPAPAGAHPLAGTMDLGDGQSEAGIEEISHDVFAEPEVALCPIVLFCSMEHGIGTTTAAVNVACILAANGKRVLLVESDLDSPSVHRFFPLDLPGPEDPDAILGPTPIVETDWADGHLRTQDYSVQIPLPFLSQGRLEFLRAGMGYSGELRSLGAAMRAIYGEAHDYVVIAASANRSDISFMCASRLPDVIVNCFTLSEEGVRGAAEVGSLIELERQSGARRHISMLPLPVWVADEAATPARISEATAFLAPYGQGEAADAREQLWGSVTVPYIPISLDRRERPDYEPLAVLLERSGPVDELVDAYTQLTAAVTMTEIAKPPPLGRSELILAYVPENRVWADWIGAVLRAAGFAVVLADASDSFAAGVDTVRRRAVVVLSREFKRSGVALNFAQSVAEAHPAGSLRPIFISVDDSRHVDTVTDVTTIDLMGVDEAVAVNRLLAILGRPDVVLLEDAPRYPLLRPYAWNVMPRNAGFTGRNAEIEALRDRFVSSGSTVLLPVALLGLGGVGKTQVATEYAHRFMSEYDLVWWVLVGGHYAAVVNSFVELAPKLGVQAGESDEETARVVREALQQGYPYRRWLLIFDDADDPAALLPLLPAGPGHVLIISRVQTWQQVADAVEVDVFNREESIDLLARSVPELSADQAQELAEVLGDLPLAVQMAGTWLATTGHPFEDYIDRLKQETISMLSVGQSPDYPHSLQSSIGISLEQLAGRSPAAMRLLGLCAFFAPEISRDLIYGQQAIEALRPSDPSLRDKSQVGQVIQEIIRMTLAKEDVQSNTIQIHRLVQALLRDWLEAEYADELMHSAHRILAAARPPRGGIDDPRNWSQYKLIWPHLEPSNAIDCDEAPVRELLIDRVRYLWKTGDYERALAMAVQLEEVWEAGPDQLRELLHLRSQRANILRFKGQVLQADELDRATLVEQVRILPPGDLHTMITMMGTAADQRSLGRFAEALKTDAIAYGSLKQSYGADHQRTLMAANNLAIDYRLNGDFHSASDRDRDTLARRTRVLASAHPHTIGTKLHLAWDLREAGDHQEALSILQSAYAESKQTLGDTFVETLRAATSLAISLRRLGRHAEARILTERACVGYEQELGAEIPDALACRLNLAADLAATGEVLAAIDLARTVRAAYEHRLGPEHPFALMALNNVAVYLGRAGRGAEALRVARDCLRAFTEVLGHEHVYTVIAEATVANGLILTGDAHVAKQRDEFVAQRLATRLGSNHPTTLAVASNSVMSFEFLRMTSPLAERFEQVLGADHPMTLAAIRGERFDFELDPQPL